MVLQTQSKYRYFLSLLLKGLAALCLVAGALLSFRPAAAQDQPPAPDGFLLVESTGAVWLYRKDYPGGSPDFVQVINLEGGAAVRLLHGAITEQRPGKGVYGGDDPRLRSRSLQSYWDEISASYDNAFCVSNGQFFYMPEYPTRLPFPLKVDGAVVSDGYAIDQFIDEKLMLEIWSNRVDIRALSQTALYSSTAPDILAGLAEDASKRAKSLTGRTFAGVADQNQDGVHETLLIFNSRLSRQSDAAAVLRSFGASKVMMLDGGGSTQLICEGTELVASERLVPQAIAVFGSGAATIPSAAYPAPLSGEAGLPELPLGAGSTTSVPEESPSPVDGSAPGDQEASNTQPSTGGDQPVGQALTIQWGTKPSGQPIKPQDVFLVPLLMAPVFLLLRLIFVNIYSTHR
jgi:hypothetical protein